jgi:NAD(P)-dependent dehydrogenase (short-subunit alcohol dehydrogenase family)
MRLADKVALITGGTGGMGSASARLFAREGAAVVITARHEEPGHALVKDITDAGGRATFVRMDTVNQDDWDNALRITRDTYGALHILMNVVGSNEPAMLPNVDIEAWNRIFEINLVGTARGIQTCAPLIKESGGGSIINIGSVGGISGNFSTAYSSSKWGLEGLSRSAAYVYADWGIRCNTIQPGFIETNIIKPITENVLARESFEKTMDTTILLRRAGRPDEIGYTALFLASADSAYITGTDIIVDGGWSSAAAYLATDRTQHTLEMIRKKMEPDQAAG